MNFNQLEYFIAIAETGHMSQAAKMLNVSQPALTSNIQKLEREIARLEEKIAELDREAEANGSDYQKLMEIAAEKEEQEAALLELYERWEALNE